MCPSGWIQTLLGIGFLLGIGILVWLATLGLQQVFHSGGDQGSPGAPHSGGHASAQGPSQGAGEGPDQRA